MNTVPLPFPLTLLRSFDWPHKLGVCDRIFGQKLAQNWVQTSTGIPWKLYLSNPVHRWIVYGKYEGPQFLNGHAFFATRQHCCREQADWIDQCLDKNPQLSVELIRKGLGATKNQLYLQSSGITKVHGYWCRVSETEGEPIEIVPLADELDAR
ncbi:MAG: hypothetical protein GDA43_12245 [Hormoscilla sp. SP5CHS1]|nr:hypothetical protein [Hormoscilla sp. SP12CHS1]MBC6453873.1 hypothetical protein [Hormoscilla sp. SP5CHS1]